MTGGRPASASALREAGSTGGIRSGSSTSPLVRCSLALKTSLRFVCMVSPNLAQCLLFSAFHTECAECWVVNKDLLRLTWSISSMYSLYHVIRREV